MWVSAYYVDNTYTLDMSRDIPWSKLTHAIHDTMTADSAGSINGIPGANADAFTSTAHASRVKALLGIGGVLTANNLNAFANNVINFVNAHNYDGVDLDFESGNYSADPDQTNYISFINALRNGLGSNRVMSIAVYWGNGLETVVQRTQSQLNQVNVMCYDMDQFLSYTYYNQAINRLTGETQGACAAEGAHFATYVPAAKIGLGIPFYGRVWSGCADSACNDGLHDPMQAWSGTPNQSTIQYKDLIASPYWAYPKGWDSVRGGSYISVNQPGSSNDRFISFTGDQQINSIVQLAKSQGYGGIMTFDLEYDFVSSQSGDARHPLAAATYAAVFGLQAPAPSPTPVTTAPVSTAPVSTAPVASPNTGTGAITTDSLVQGTVQWYYVQRLDSTVSSPSWSVVAGSLPPGLSLDPYTGVISGLATQAGMYNFTTQVIGSSTVSKAFVLVINN